MKKYNISINIMFWILLVFIGFAAVVSITNPAWIAEAISPREERVLVKTHIQRLEDPEETEWFYFEATGYSANDPAQGTDSTTATGLEVEEGIVAVDPEVIPLGSQLEIKGLGEFVAEDTGGKIKGNRIDIFFESKQEAIEFGREGVWVTIKDEEIKVARFPEGSSIFFYNGYNVIQ